MLLDFWDTRKRNANRYAYAGDDPINGSDPSGNLSKAAQCSIAVAAIGLSVGVLVVATFGCYGHLSRRRHGTSGRIRNRYDWGPHMLKGKSL